jgi:hypothetical protein
MSTLGWIFIAGLTMSALALVGAVTVLLSAATLERVLLPIVGLDRRGDDWTGTHARGRSFRHHMSHCGRASSAMPRTVITSPLISLRMRPPRSCSLVRLSVTMAIRTMRLSSNMYAAI